MRRHHRAGEPQPDKQIAGRGMLPRGREVSVALRRAEEIAAAEIRFRLVEARALLDNPALENETIFNPPSEVHFEAVDAGATEICLGELDLAGRRVVCGADMEQIGQ